MDIKSVEVYRNEFPVVKNHVYLDHAGVAPVSQRVVRAVQQFMTESADGGAFHYPEWITRIASARQNAARLINADIDEIAFVKSTSHGLSIVAEGLTWQEGDNVIVYEKEFPSNLFPWLNLKRKGVETRFIPFSSGRILIDDIASRMDKRTRIVSISSVQFTNGFRVDISRLGSLCRERGIFLCVDAIQSLGVIPMDVKRYQIDFLSADGHKWLLGPEGIGIFYCRKELVELLAPSIVGWKSVENEFEFERPELRFKKTAQRFEEGSQNVMGILGLGAAIELLLDVGIETVQDRVQGLGDMIIREAMARGFIVLTPNERAERGGIITVKGNFDPVMYCDVLKKQGIIVNARAGGLRVSPHFYTIEEEIQCFFEMLGRLTG